MPYESFRICAMESVVKFVLVFGLRMNESLIARVAEAQRVSR
jgi:hypothetical protein